MLRNMETNNIKYSETNMIAKSELINLISKEYDEIPENFRTYYSPMKTDTLNSLINENLGGFMDVFSIVEKNLNIIDKVQLGLTCKDMHEIMKPIIKKDNVHVVRCGCEKDYDGCMDDGKPNPERDQMIQSEREFCKKNNVKNIVSFGCIRPDEIAMHNLENAVHINDSMRYSYHYDCMSVHMRKDKFDIQMVSSYFDYFVGETMVLNTKKNPNVKLHYYKDCWECDSQDRVSQCEIKRKTIALKKLIDIRKNKCNQEFFTIENAIKLCLSNKPWHDYCSCEYTDDSDNESIE